MSDVMTFTLDVERMVERAKQNIDQVVRKVVIDIGTSLIEKSSVGNPVLWKNPPPKGYVGGRMRANWQIGINSIPKGALDIIDASGGASVTRIAGGVGAGKGGDVFYLINNLPYARALEYGHSKQAPNGMVGITIAEFDQILNGAARSVKK